MQNKKQRNSKIVLELKNVTFAYANKIILDNINFSINSGDFLGIIGPNGGGKTTLLKVILGLLKPKEGSIEILGNSIKQFKEWHKISYIPQKVTNFDFQFPATVEEIVALGLLSKKKFPRFITNEDYKKIDKALNKVGMLKFKKSKIGELSGGQQQKVFIAKAIINEPKLLILDEPTVGIDKKSQDSFYNLLNEINKSGITIIMVTHDLGYITKHVNKVACINKNLIFHGTHREFCNSNVIDEILGRDKHIMCHEHIVNFN